MQDSQLCAWNKKKFKAAVPGILDNRDFSNEMVGYFYIGRCYWGLNDKEKAMTYFKKVDEMYNERVFSVSGSKREGYEFMIKYYSDKKMLKSQLHYVEKLLEVDKEAASHPYLSARENQKGV